MGLAPSKLDELLANNWVVEDYLIPGLLHCLIGSALFLGRRSGCQASNSPAQETALNANSNADVMVPIAVGDQARRFR